MTVIDSKNAIAAYLRKEPDDFVKNGIDLILLAMNNAKKSIQLFHDFNAQQEVVQITVNPVTGGTLNTAYLYGGDPETDLVKVKDYITFYMVVPPSGGLPASLCPLYHHAKKNVAVWTKERSYNLRGRYSADYFRYPSDAFLDARLRTPTDIYIHGNKVFFNPDFTEAKTVAIDVISWLAPYVEDDDTDWMLEEGSMYIMWAAICELNYLTNAFTVGLDGNLGPPTKMRDDARDTLVMWDDYQTEVGRQPMGIR